jgi:choline dehydrogenase-like flavoprotein
VERRFLSHEEDVEAILDGIEIARRVAAAEPLPGLLAEELRPGQDDPVAYVRATTRNYFHPAGTCALGRVVDVHGRVLGTEGLYVADASVMPTIPRANTNLTTAAIAEHLTRGFS